MMLNTTSTVMERTIQVDPFRAYLDALDLAGKMVERQMSNDSNFPSLITMMRLSPDSEFSCLLLLHLSWIIS